MIIDPLDYLKKFFMDENPNRIFIPKKHTKMTYAKQNRLARKRKRAKQ